MNQIIDLVLFLLPIYIANAVPVVLGGGAPLDFGLKLPDGQRLLGDSKTVRGFVAGVVAGTLAGGIIALAYQLPFFSDMRTQFVGGAVLAFGTMFGDALGSMIKRRFGVSSGKPFVLDSIFFLVIALIFVFPLAFTNLYDMWNLVFFLVLTVILHPLTNMIANRAGLKNVPW
jgi:CDP-2,3-bis-(O-geranylgeranyl)-sn-glycerol synthase